MFMRSSLLSDAILMYVEGANITLHNQQDPTNGTLVVDNLVGKTFQGNLWEFSYKYGVFVCMYLCMSMCVNRCLSLCVYGVRV